MSPLRVGPAALAAVRASITVACVLGAWGPWVRGARAEGPAPARPAAKFDGKKLFTDKTCVTCHAIGGPSFGVGPELTQVGWHREPDWIRAWLTDPPKIKKDTSMPKLAWSCPEEMQAVIDFLLTSKKPIPAADSADGQKLFQDYKCSACHALARRGGKPQFPDLAGVGKRRGAAWLDRWMRNPQAVKKGTWEPTFKFTECERAAIVRYLVLVK